ncbi:unnamed protein product [Blepharisma stoltei]|uniref:Peptidase S11 D-alanyl-D-alanine carboxypeptidase A N-terminal domain-containing protein n=1 Tax=Blepharisma stoltei TaxID=1481888 RepID=A0AAU9JUI5_9CILI|nr:unnamed protein product [Blepharisma stoltei]
MAYAQVDDYSYAIQAAESRIKNEQKRSHSNPFSLLPDNLIKSSNKDQVSLTREMPSDITAQSWAIYDPVAKEFLATRCSTQKREIASITKVMTCILVLEICDENDISLNDLVSIGSNAANIVGTTANLEEGDRVRIKDLLYGLMLPSGNDAAVALSTYIGSLFNPNIPTLEFIRMMNIMAKYLELDNTHYQNTHGLSSKPNISSAKDVCVLAAYAMQNKKFRKIVNTQTYTCEIDNEYWGTRTVHWFNTNKLLGRGFDGVKTGTTPKAGPCLCVRTKDSQRPLYITTLGSKTDGDRWMDASKLSAWARGL